VPALVEEVLRLATPTANMWRVTTEDTEVEGVAIPKGAMCMIRFAAANRDPAVFPEPDRMDVTRDNLSEHLSFGLGVHFCLGAQLARKEMTVAFRSLLGRLTNLRLASGAEPPRHHPNVLLWGMDALHLEYERL
jgi:cytochrome P450